MAQEPPSGPGQPHYRDFTITHFRHTTLGRTPLDEWLSRRRDLYLTAHNTHKRKTFMPSAGFETAIPALERPQTYTLDHVATGIGSPSSAYINFTRLIHKAGTLYQTARCYLLLFLNTVSVHLSNNYTDTVTNTIRAFAFFVHRYPVTGRFKE
jgi:hypothetical protein